MARVLKPNLVTMTERPSLSPVFQMKTDSQTQSPCWREGEVLRKGLECHHERAFPLGTPGMPLQWLPRKREHQCVVLGWVW